MNVLIVHFTSQRGAVLCVTARRGQDLLPLLFPTIPRAGGITEGKVLIVAMTLSLIARGRALACFANLLASQKQTSR